MAVVDQFPAVFARLRAIMHAHANGLNLATDAPDKYVLVRPSVPDLKHDVWFGAIEIKKNYVSYHLPPVYTFPALLTELSPALRKRMQGKSCFNFTKIDDALLSELDDLTTRTAVQFRHAYMAADNQPANDPIQAVRRRA